MPSVHPLLQALQEAAMNTYRLSNGTRCLSYAITSLLADVNNDRIPIVLEEVYGRWIRSGCPLDIHDRPQVYPRLTRLELLNEDG